MGYETYTNDGHNEECNVTRILICILVLLLIVITFNHIKELEVLNAILQTEAPTEMKLKLVQEKLNYYLK